MELLIFCASGTPGVAHENNAKIVHKSPFNHRDEDGTTVVVVVG